MKKLAVLKIAMVVAVQFCIGLPGFVAAQIPKINIDTIPVISGLTFPMQLTHAGDASRRLFIAERRGVIKVFRPGQPDAPGVYLNMNAPDSTVSSVGEGGLLSIAFHPEFASNGLLFVYYTDLAGDLVLARYTASDPAADAITSVVRQQILKIPHPVNKNHNGGELHFNKEDGLLYLSTGDGGGANDVPGNAQNNESLLGKILRIDVTPTDSQNNTYTIPDSNPYGNEVFAKGLRNPFRWSFDSETNDLWIGDVGQGAQEEINQLSKNAALGANFGWRCFEGDSPSPTADLTGCDEASAYTMPVYTYQTGILRGQSVVGGVVYRGKKWPMQGYYIGADYFSGDIHKIAADGSVKEYQTSRFTGITDFGEDEDGEIYAVSNGAVYSISAEIILPVRLASFSGERSVEGVKLSWETASEENFQGFDIEFSTDAKTFEKAGNVAGANTQSGSRYTFSHNTAAKSDLYYRLKMIDTDQTFSYSRIIPVQAAGNDDLFVLPSLIDNGILNVNAGGSFRSVELVSTSGQVLIKREIVSSAVPLRISIAGMAPGIYVVRLAGQDSVVQQKVLVLK
ncbi:PQQ-dependent sugar dehydrogenase [Dyadobacter sandarakinus]|uniref:PQQ-dependent sugar dehydrogenase n=1 Tax=Dyadobacter sandarakinus TaxID=2747268 RepID=A0ABX7IB77_9BACT|nr:PQQ-dependent sugar dehydrogenase [Dyadobacter sandarakinus]QRR03068.1 PQQ-dependent sugar dehydrogenase [Dyadobacter sandarakinus]